MATLVEMPELQSTDRCQAQDAGNYQGRDAPPRGEVSMEQILEKMSSTPREAVLRGIASSPGIRRVKVLSIRRQITDGTYEVEDRLDRTIDRVLEAITGPFAGPCLDGARRSGSAQLAAG